MRRFQGEHSFGLLIVKLRQRVNLKATGETKPGKFHSEEISDRATGASILNPWHRD